MLALTDGPTSPLAPIADIALYAQAGNRLSANSDATVLALIEALCGAVAHRAERPVKAAAEMTEFVLPWLYGAHAGSADSAANTGNPAGAPSRQPVATAGDESKPAALHRTSSKHPKA